LARARCRSAMMERLGGRSCSVMNESPPPCPPRRNARIIRPQLAIPHLWGYGGSALDRDFGSRRRTELQWRQPAFAAQLLRGAGAANRRMRGQGAAALRS
jgi:hypothetical protein